MLDVSGPIKVTPNVISLGDAVRVTIPYIKHSIDIPEFTRTLVNIETNTIIATIQSKTSRRATGEGVFNFLFLIPKHKDAVGKCKIRLTFRYWKFGFRAIDRDFESEPFIVTNGVLE